MGSSIRVTAGPRIERRGLSWYTESIWQMAIYYLLTKLPPKSLRRYTPAPGGRLAFDTVDAVLSAARERTA